MHTELLGWAKIERIILKWIIVKFVVRCGCDLGLCPVRGFDTNECSLVLLP